MSGCILRLQIRQALEMCGGATESVFPQVEAWLLADTRRQAALEFVASRKDMGRYRSIMDFLFCEIYTDFRRDCFKFYLGNGPKLKDMMSTWHLRRFNRTLQVVCRVTYDVYRRNEQISWAELRRRSTGRAA